MATASDKFFVYGLADPRTDEIRYIGKSTQGIRRPKDHERFVKLGKDRTHKGNWIRQLTSIDLSYDVLILEIFSSVTGLEEAEISWIAFGRSLGWPLTNHTSGGEGTPGFKHTEETKRKIGLANSGKIQSAASRLKKRQVSLGRQISVETRAKLSTALKGKSQKKRTAEQNENNRKAQVGKTLSLEHREKIKQAMLRRNSWQM